MLLLAALFLAAAACGDADDEAPDPEAQPAPDVSTFAEGSFDDLPRHPRSDPVSARRETEGVVAQSFTVRNTTAEEVLDFYVRTLRELPVRSEAQEIGEDTWRGIWETADGDVLIVSATQEPQADDEPPGAPGDNDVQYSLSLGPEDEQMDVLQGGEVVEDEE